ncbi:MAG: tRNA (adenosine(37)-N6)-threonylcarbamoyltransferase complex dimerization subunit type 1 TsaB [Firmicutes bacterium]|nr:tRNA (adenosine(37)-N6)-threonylcarbamoyltransferase complex dimerization subunit type 1 TsaB [Bacillota bacterium]
MLILGFDTATAACTVALVEDGRLLAELTVVSPRVHSARLLPLIAQVFQEAGRDRRELAAVAAGVGPGSFTGLRIGLSAAKALAFALGIPCVPVSTLAAIAAGLPSGSGLVAPLLDAKRGEVYTALYQVEPAGDEPAAAPGLTEMVPPRLVPLGAWLEELDRLRNGASVFLAGDAVPAEVPEWAVPVPHGLRLPRGWAVAALAARAVAAGQTVAPEALAPVYLRRSEAEVLWDRRHGAQPAM